MSYYMKASTQSESAIIIPGILYFGFSWTRPIKLMSVLLCSPARSSEFFMDRFPFELHKDSLICCLSVFKAKRLWFQLIAPLVSKQDFDETLLKLCISDHQTRGQEHRMEELECERPV